MDVEFEEVEEGVADEVDGAVDFALLPVVEFEGSSGLVANGEGDPLDFVFLVFNVLASLPTIQSVCQNLSKSSR